MDDDVRVQQSKLVKTSVDLTKLMCFCYEIPSLRFNRQYFHAENATVEDIHLICVTQPVEASY